MSDAIKSQETEELEKAMAEAEAKEEVLERAAAIRNVKSVQQFKQVLQDSGLESKSLNSATLLSLMRQEPKFKIEQADDGSLHVEVDGQPVRLKTALHVFSDEHTDLFRESYSAMVKKTIKSREDFTSEQDKVDYISRFGGRAFEELPAHPPKKLDLNTLTGEEYHALSLAEKTKIIGEVHLSGIAGITSRRGSDTGVKVSPKAPRYDFKTGITYYPTPEEKK